MHGNNKIKFTGLPIGQASLFFYLYLLNKSERDKIKKEDIYLGFSKLCKI